MARKENMAQEAQRVIGVSDWYDKERDKLDKEAAKALRNGSLWSRLKEAVNISREHDKLRDEATEKLKG